MRLVKDMVKTALANQGYTFERTNPFEAEFKADLEAFQKETNEIGLRHRYQTKEHVEGLKKKYETTYFGEFYVWDIVSSLSRCFDAVDFRLGVGSQEVHVLQMLDCMERDGITDPEFLLAAIIHDIGKVLLNPHEPPEHVCFNNFVIGDNEPGIGLDNCTLTYSQDEYLYSRLKDHLPDHLAWLIRYHGISIPDCEPLMDKRDREYTERYLAKFADYDLGSKCMYRFPRRSLEDYRDLVESAFPKPIKF